MMGMLVSSLVMWGSGFSSSVMAGLVPAIHALLRCCKDVDARHKAGHDEHIRSALVLVPIHRQHHDLGDLHLPLRPHGD
jgi:hypothetical protein